MPRKQHDVNMANNIDYNKQVIEGNPPSKSNCYKVVMIAGHGSLAKQDKLKKYEESFFWQCNMYRDKKINKPFRITLDAYLTSIRQDLDNIFKIVLDCLQSCKAITNDNLCAEIHARKFLDKANPRVEFLIETI